MVVPISLGLWLVVLSVSITSSNGGVLQCGLAYTALDAAAPSAIVGFTYMYMYLIQRFPKLKICCSHFENIVVTSPQYRSGLHTDG